MQFLFMMTANIKLMTRMIDGCLILKKIEEETSEIASESDGHSAMLTVEKWAFLLGFSCPIPTSLLLAPIILGPGEATHSELLGTKTVNWVLINKPTYRWLNQWMMIVSNEQKIFSNNKKSEHSDDSHSSAKLKKSC